MKTYIVLLVASFILFFGFADRYVAEAQSLSGERLNAVNRELSTQPKNAELWARRGRVYRDEGKWGKAARDFAFAYQLDPHYVKALYWKAEVLFRAGHFDRARLAAYRYIKQKPQDSDAYILLGRIYSGLAKFNIAIRHYNRAIVLDDLVDVIVYRERLQIQQRINTKAYSRMIRGLMDGIKRQGYISELVEPLVDIYIEISKFAKAREVIKKLPSSVRMSAYWLNRQADIEKKSGDLWRAKQLYESCLNTILNMPMNQRIRPEFVALRDRARVQIALLSIK